MAYDHVCMLLRRLTEKSFWSSVLPFTGLHALGCSAGSQKFFHYSACPLDDIYGAQAVVEQQFGFALCIGTSLIPQTKRSCMLDVYH